MPTTSELVAVDLLNNRRLLLWIAAGTSVPAGIPPDSRTAGGLANQLALIHFGRQEEVDREMGQPFNLAELAQRITKARVRDLIIQQGWDELEGTAGHHAIAALKCEGFDVDVVTINYDPLIENGLKTLNLQPVIVCSPGQVHLLTDNVLHVIKLHGCPFSDRNLNNLIMLAADLRTPQRWIVNFLRGRLQERIFIYSGFSGNVDYVRDAVAQIYGDLEGHVPGAYAVDIVSSGTVFAAGNSLGEFYQHCGVIPERYTADGSDRFFEDVANRVFRGIMLNELEDASEDAAEYQQPISFGLSRTIRGLEHAAVRGFARRLLALSKNKVVRLRDVDLRGAIKWMLLLTSSGILEDSSFRPVLTLPFNPGLDSHASDPIVIIDGLRKNALHCRERLKERICENDFKEEFRLRGLARCYFIIINCVSFIDASTLDIVPREEDTTVEGYDPAVCYDENSLLGSFGDMVKRFAR